MGLGKPPDLEDKDKAQLKILVVDDDELNRRMMKVLLTREGHNVDLAGNGVEALDAVKYHQYNLVLMDLQMPIMDGVEASRRIRDWERGKSRTFIVALTASYMPEEGHLLYEAGIDNYISKPFEMEHIRRMLNYISDVRKDSPTAGTAQAPTQDSLDNILDVQTGIRRVGGDQEVYRELLGDFMDELPIKMNGIQEHFMQRDLPSLGRAAHNLKGVAANLGALGLSEIAGKLDKQCNEGYTDSIEGLILDLKETGSRLRERVRAFLAGANKLESLQQV